MHSPVWVPQFIGRAFFCGLERKKQLVRVVVVFVVKEAGQPGLAEGLLGAIALERNCFLTK